ncbi:MAG: PAS domain-containing protein [Candidatus Saganbacteria bacterium]|nr:PAS domain-containing protein [Candidatus Saganbacteria bacterium]
MGSNHLGLNEQELQAIVLDQIGDLIVATDLAGRIIYVNQAVCRALKRDRTELIGAAIDILGQDPAQGAEQKKIIEATLKGGSWHGRVINLAKDGSQVVLDSRTWLIKDKQGVVKGICGVSQDISGSRQFEAELKKKVDELERMTKIMIGREDRILELKKRIKELENRSKDK